VKLTAHTDGASKGNPGPAAIGYTIEKDGVILEDYHEYIGEATNNIAEYRALLAVMKRLKTLGAKTVTIFSDSELLVQQITGIYRVKNRGLKPLHAEVMNLSRKFDAFTIIHIPRCQNAHADRLANQALKDHKKNREGKANNSGLF
jgi:ribonuclease HI